MSFYYKINTTTVMFQYYNMDLLAKSNYYMTFYRQGVLLWNTFVFPWHQIIMS